MEVYDEAKITELFTSLKEGDMSSFEEFYAFTKQQVFYNILSLVKDHNLAEEVLQETYVSFLERLQELDANKNPLGYLFVVSKNKSLKLLSRVKRESDYDSVENSLEVSESATVNDDYIFKKMKELLSDKEYRIVILHVLEGMSHKEIAKLIHKPIGSVTWSYSNAIKKLQKGLGEYYGRTSN